MARTRRGLPRVRHNVDAQLVSGRRFFRLRGSYRKPDGVTASAPTELPAIVREPVWIRFADQYFDLRREGFYRFWDCGQLRYTSDEDIPEWVDEAQQYAGLIVFRDDILRFLGAIACVQLHGSALDHAPHPERLAQIKSGALSLTCGPVTEFVSQILSDCGWRVRTVRTVQTTRPYNRWSDGHILFESWWPRYGKWILADVDNHVVFMRGNRYLNAGEVAECIRGGKAFRLRYLTPVGMGALDISAAFNGGIPWTWSAEPWFWSDAEKRAGLSKYLSLPMLLHDGQWAFYHGDQTVCARVLRNHAYCRAISREQWWRRFYGCDPPRARR